MADDLRLETVSFDVGKHEAEANNNNEDNNKKHQLHQRNQNPLQKNLSTEKTLRAKAIFDSVSENESNNTTKKRFVQEQHTLLILVFHADGFYEFRELRRDEILREARQVIPTYSESQASKPLSRSMTDSPLMSSNSNDTPISSKGRISTAPTGTLKARDIRLLDSIFSNSHDPSIVVRKHAVLINLEPIKSLILYNCCFFVVPDGADAILTTLMDRLRQDPERDKLDMESFETFDIRALEAIFITVCNVLNKELVDLRPEVEKTLSSVLKTGSFSLEKLRMVKKELNQLVSRMKGIQHAFNEVLENDRDMALMNLTKIKQNPDYYFERNQVVWEGDHEEIELLLENYVQSVDGTYSQAQLLSHEIDSAMDLLYVRLDTARNQLLRVDLMVSSITSVAAVGALVAAIFGMNLRSGVEDTPEWFWTVAGILIFGCAFSVALMFLYIKYKGWLIT
mmetsp:Transcript_12189/g.15849  ORF Transcript_12189/g.15849 Transcript_12189/m.15849 type:complete len:453 (+) Transcript_12189:89-1447(+)|eukprot:CAMPEP_0204835062 /NCGR_PEP_ID=MMETSP1346-20131115/21550_1 /ASSEMBLY_ACC=CAM_ASM_000771 /TAXON_ID=215587 /ORGANISM="Aplanochytrium stocchinoi, Strain GSBS06" /LENGTH=452 /DNA_ID=CAMNT_0051968763 /DNA_START=41 /DNA_END=1399 /DNA_ORIENTATION=+